jgi:beta-lactamase class A
MRRLVLLLLTALGATGALAQQAQKEEILFGRLKEAIAAEDRAFDGVLGVAILDRSTGRRVLHNADEVFPTASTIKVAVLAELFRQSEQGGPGKASLRDAYTPNPADIVDDSPFLAGLTPGVSRITNHDLAHFMTSVSDNSATNILIDRVGMDNVNALLKSIGLKETRLRRKMMDLAAAREGRENTATPSELITLLEAIETGRLLGKESTQDLLRVLSTPKDSSIPRLIQEGVRIANKPGALEGVRCDAGIVYVPGRPFTLAVMTTYAANEKAAGEIISRVAAAAYSCFERLGRSSPLGRVISPRDSH